MKREAVPDLHKPFPSLPIGRQFEQVLNARYLEHLSYGRFAPAASAPVLGDFVEAPCPTSRALAGYTHKDGNRRDLRRGGRLPRPARARSRARSRRAPSARLALKQANTDSARGLGLEEAMKPQGKKASVSLRETFLGSFAGFLSDPAALLLLETKLMPRKAGHVETIKAEAEGPCASDPVGATSHRVSPAPTPVAAIAPCPKWPPSPRPVIPPSPPVHRLLPTLSAQTRASA